MARFVTGNTFGATDTVTNTTLNNAVNNAAISTDSVDNNTIEVNSNALRLKDSSSKTTGVTFAKMQHISTAKVLGRASASEGDVEEAFDFKDEDNMSSNSATALASQQSIKAYADAAPLAQMKTNNVSGASVASNTESVTLPNGLIMKFGVVENSPFGNTGVNVVTFGTAFPNAVLNAQLTWETVNTGFTNPVYLKGNTVSTSGLTINNTSGTCDVYWQAIGR